LNFGVSPGVYSSIIEETTMGILGKIVAGKLLMSAAERARNRREAPGTGQYIPASQADTTALDRTGNSILDRAGRFYRENPRKVQVLGLVAAAMLLARVKRGRGF
jgi:hypothetical protein